MSIIGTGFAICVAGDYARNTYKCIKTTCQLVKWAGKTIVVFIGIQQTTSILIEIIQYGKYSLYYNGCSLFDYYKLTVNINIASKIIHYFVKLPTRPPNISRWSWYWMSPAEKRKKGKIVIPIWILKIPFIINNAIMKEYNGDGKLVNMG